MDQNNNHNNNNKKKKKNKRNKNNKKQQPTTKLKETDSTSNVPDHNAAVINVSNNAQQLLLANATEPSAMSTDESQTENDAQMQKEPILEDKNKLWLKENDEILQKEAAQEETIKRLHNEKNESMLHEVTSLKKKILHLEKEKDELIHKESILEQINKQLQSENKAHLQKEAGLEVKIVQLEGEKDSWLQKEAVLQEKINNLIDDAAVLNLNEASLQDKIKHMEEEREDWILRENSARESIASQKNENIKLRAQVQELEQSSKTFLLEKQQLQENISSLQLKINNLERTATSPFPSIMNKVTSRDGDGDNQIEASRALVEKLRAENSKLIEKVNELHVKPDLIGVRMEDSLPIGSAIEAVGTRSSDIAENSALPPALAVSDDDNKIVAADTIIEVSKMMVPLSSSNVSLKDVVIEDERNIEHINDKSAFRIANTSEIEEVDEIVQIPLDEHQVKETNLKVAELEENSDISLTDAPLIGAPFRLISFVARYVSGADLVK